MRTETLRHLTTKLLASSALVALIAGAPVTVNFVPDSGVITITSSIALAKGDSSGSGSDGSGGGGDSSGSGSDGSGGGGDSSGSGSDGSDDDNSGSGSSGSGDSDDDNSGSGSSGSGDSDDDDDKVSGSSQQEFTTADGTKVEVSGDNIEVEFANGWKEEIEDGQFEMKDPNGNTVVERPATEEDRNRLEQFVPG